MSGNGETGAPKDGKELVPVSCFSVLDPPFTDLQIGVAQNEDARDEEARDSAPCTCVSMHYLTFDLAMLCAMRVPKAQKPSDATLS